MPEGKRKDRVKTQVDAIMRDLRDKTFSLDSFAAYLAANTFASLQARGITPPLEDLMIAAIAKANNCTIATRNTKDFEELGVDTINPFEYKS